MAAGHSGCDGTMNTINNCCTGLKCAWAFRIVSALLFIAGAARTIYGERCMSSGMAMPGGWTMSMAWMRIEGQSWLAAIVRRRTELRGAHRPSSAQLSAGSVFLSLTQFVRGSGIRLPTRTNSDLHPIRHRTFWKASCSSALRGCGFFCFHRTAHGRCEIRHLPHKPQSGESSCRIRNRCGNPEVRCIPSP